MPLLSEAKARTRKGFSKNVETEMKAGKPQKQAVKKERRKNPSD